MQRERILVTGASGFLGTAVQRRLVAAGHEVVGLDVLAAAEPGAVDHIVDDLSDGDRLAGLIARSRPSRIVHAGGVSGPMVLADDPLATLRINVAGTLNLLAAALTTKVRTFIHCSSISAVGNYFEAEPIGVDQPMRPDSPYGCSKAASEFLVQALHGRGAIDAAVLRFSTIYGPGRRTEILIHDVVEAGIAGRTARIAPTTAWPYIFIDDAADATVAALFATGRRQLTYYVTHPAMVSADDISRAAGEALGRGPVALEVAGAPMARGPADVEAPARDFGFRAKVDHREGLRRLVAARRGG
jgi:nucleoside-diphosphate-sugar epimerase